MAKIRVFTLNSNGKIELSKEELQQMLDESYRDGCNSVTITTPVLSVQSANAILCH